MANMLFDTRDMIQTDNHATRIPVVLCLDTSQSMDTNGGFDALNEGVQAFFETCQNDSVNRFGFDVAIVTFGAQGVNRIQDFRPIWNQNSIPHFAFTPENWVDGTPLAQGVDLAMKGLQKRKDEYKDNNIGYYQPFLVIITDGQSTEDAGPRSPFRATQEEVVSLQRKRKLKVIAIGVGNQNYAELANFVVDKKILLAKDFSAFDLAFEFISQSMSNSSTNGGLQGKNEISPISEIAEALYDEGEYGMSVEDFGRDDD